MFQRGDKLRLKSFNECSDTEDLELMTEMRSVFGEEVTVSFVDDDGDFSIQEGLSNYYYSPEWVEDKVEVKETDFSYLEGRTIFWRQNSRMEIGIVAGCDYDIGISIVNRDNKEDQLSCLPGPSAPGKMFLSEEHYDQIFEFMIEQIESEVYDSIECVKKRQELDKTYTRGEGALANCPYKS